MYMVRCGIKLNHWNEGQLAQSKKTFMFLEDAKVEVYYLLNTMVKKMFEKIAYTELDVIDDEHLVWYEDEDDYYLKARMDGKIYDENNEGEFYIDIIQK